MPAKKSAPKKSAPLHKKPAAPATSAPPAKSAPIYAEASAFKAHGFEAVIDHLEQEVQELYPRF